MNRSIMMMRSLVFSNLRSRNYSNLPKEAVIYLDKNTIVCWHPEQPFPYEFTKPLPVERIRESVLQIDKNKLDEECDRVLNEVTAAKREFKIANELAELTQTTMHRWFPRSRDKKAKKTWRERKYL